MVYQPNLAQPTVRVGLTLDPETAERLRARAREQHLSVSDAIRKAVDAWLPISH